MGQGEGERQRAGGRGEEGEGERQPDLDLSFVPRVRADVVAIELDGELVVSDPRTDQLHHLDAVAAVVWEHFDGVNALQEVVESLASRYAADADTVARDVAAFARELARLDLLQNVPPDPPPDDAPRRNQTPRRP